MSLRDKNTIRAFLILSLLLLSRCATELPECGGAEIDVAKVQGLRRTLFSSGPKASLVVPNPIDATGNASTLGTDSSLSREVEGFSLPDLVAKRLENAFLKVRIKDTNDDVSILATPNAQGDYSFAVSDVHYSETMAYYSVSSMIHYVESLGFSINRNRPLYVMVRAQDENGGTSGATAVNALYSHNYLNPSLPRTMRLYGDGQFAPAIDRDMYWHEFGHFFNESVSGEVGIDYAADSGAYFTEASAIHECLADYLAESVGNKGDIGKWIARNFDSIPAGEALRSAVPKQDEFNQFSSIAQYDGSDKNLDRYRMAEWCTRVLWDLRSQFVKEDPNGGAIFSDRLVYSAVSLLGKDTSMSKFRQALSKADKQLHCGFHENSIEKAFVSRGFEKDPAKLSGKLSLQASSVVSGKEVSFQMKITNPNGEVARNVRVRLEARDGALTPTTYLQGYGDLPGGKSVLVGGNGLSLDYSVYGSIERTRSQRIPYRLRVQPENGPETILEGEL